MNRTARRKQKNFIKPKTYVLTDDQIRGIKDQAVDEAVEKAFILMIGIPSLVLRDNFGFGKGRLGTFGDKVLELYEAFNTGVLTLDDINRTIEDETGIVIKR